MTYYRNPAVRKSWHGGTYGWSRPVHGEYGSFRYRQYYPHDSDTDWENIGTQWLTPGLNAKARLERRLAASRLRVRKNPSRSRIARRKRQKDFPWDSYEIGSRRSRYWTSKNKRINRARASWKRTRPEDKWPFTTAWHKQDYYVKQRNKRIDRGPLRPQSLPLPLVRMIRGETKV